MYEANILFHSAAEVNDERRMWDVNFKGTETILKVAKKSKLKILCHFSSIDVIGRSETKVITEETCCNPKSLYARSKWEAEQLVAEGIENCKVLIIRPARVIDEEFAGALCLPANKSLCTRIKKIIKGREYTHVVHAENVVEAALYLISQNILNVYNYY